MRAILLLLGISMFSVNAVANSSDARLGTIAGAMMTHGAARPPHGFVAFCHEHEAECRAEGPMRRVLLTAERLFELEAVNQDVNESIRPMTDKELYGTDEHWALPDDSGDCEDYALLKRRILIGMGWPTSALLLTVVRDERGEGHAVLTARTSWGDLILDNKQPHVTFWHEAGYQFVSRQSHFDPRSWVLLGEPGAPPATAWVAKVNAVLAERLIEMLPH